MAMRKTVLAAAALAVAMVAPAMAQTREVRVGFTQDALTLDPANARNRETETIIRNMADGLVTRDANMRVVPEIAESLRMIDPLTWEASIRRGIRFHSGDELDAHDVKLTLDRITKPNAMGGQTSPRQSLLSPLRDTEVVDSHRVRLHLRAPWPILPVMLPFQQMVNRRHVERAGANIATQLDGTGPFRLVEWRRGDRIVMERFAGYYGGSPDIPPVGPAQVDRVIFRVMPDNSARVAALLAGEVDIINELPASAMRRVEQNQGTQVARVNGTRTFFVAFNTAKPPFNDVRVRRALNHAVNRQLIIDRVLLGTAVPLNGAMSPDSPYFNASLPEYRYDPDLARRLLAEAGHPNGIDLVIDVIGAFREQAEAVAQMMQRAGVRARVQVWEGAVLAPMWLNAERRRERDMYFSSWGNATLDPSDLMVPTLRTGARGNSSGFSNAEVDRLLDAAETEVDDAKRREMYNRAQVIVNQEAPWIFLWLPQDLYGVSRRITGWRPQSDSRINLHDVRLAQ
ncbi:MAG: ABC transporter substrate-binding protein [Alphaproteobacteria bacterium]|nr:ABC transporter substrate-binding protein [Alphaproteobacteria bacterium]